MMKENKQIKKEEKYFDPPKIVNRKNYHLMLSEFNEILAKPEKKLLFFNIDFSNLKIFTQRNIKLDNYLIDYIKELSRIKSENQNETQIIYTEFLICKQSKKTKSKLNFYSFLIPSIKFHKFNQQESFIKIDPDCLKYFYLNKPTYQFSKICQVDSISYLSLLEKEKIEVNLTKILTKGKPTKKENTKSYYFFPKNVIIPTKEKQNELVSHIKDSYNDIKEIKNSTETNSDDYAIKTIVIKDNYVAERLIHFDWRILANQLDKSVVRGEIDKCSIGKGAKNNISESENSNTKIIFFNFCHELAEYIKEIRKNIHASNFSKSSAGNFTNFILNSPNEINPMIKKIIYNWKNFIELYFYKKISINLILSETENRKVEFEFKLIKTSEKIESEVAGFEIFIFSLNKFFLNKNSNEANLFEESNIYKNENLSNFDILSLFPHEITENLEIAYFVNISINLKSLKEINLDRDLSTKFTFEDLFLNMNNEKDILFDYDLETELYRFVTALGKIVSCRIEGSSKNIFHFDNKEFFKDFLIIAKCKNNSMIEIFGNYLIDLRLKEEKRELSFSFNNKDKNKLMEFLKSFKENEKNFKYKLMEIFHQSKIEMITEEEFGLANFFKFLLDAEKISKSNLTIVAPNLLHKLLIIFIEFFSDNNGIDSECFLKFFAQSNFIDLNYLSKKSGLKLIKELSCIKNDTLFANNNKVIEADYITQKNFLVFAKFINQLKIVQEDPFDSKILFEEENLNENRNKFFVNNLIKSNSADDIYVLRNTGELIKEKLEENNIDNEKKLYLSKDKHSSMEGIIEKCKGYGNFMVKSLI